LCAVCGGPFDPLAKAARECADCRANRYHIAPPFTAVRSVYEFDGPAREAVHRFKYQDKIALATPLAAVLNDFLEHQPDGVTPIPLERLSLIVPVPLHPWRQYRRGYNQSALLARELSKLRGVPHAEILRRTRYTTPQIELKAGERAANVKGAFAIDEKRFKTLSPPVEAVLLIDDVHTTGATLAECAGVLKKSGIAEVYGLTLAR
jgi:ComF family protein